MKTLKANIKISLARFLADASGATAIEYALIATIVGVGIVIGLQAIPQALNTLFNDVNDAFE